MNSQGPRVSKFIMFKQTKQHRKVRHKRKGMNMSEQTKFDKFRRYGLADTGKEQV